MEERWLKKYRDKTGLRYLTLRFGTIFGVSPGMRFHTAVNKFCWQAVMGEPISVWRTALDQMRPYLDLGDAIRVVHHFISRQQFDGHIFNVVTQNATVRQVAMEISHYVPKLKIKYVNSKIMNQLSYEVCSGRILKTGFVFRGSLRTGIMRTLKKLQQANTL
jgi:nucleoside-diphosphate-sugar epimerase